MSSLHPASIIFLTLTVVTLAALAYVPTKFLGNYKRLADRYETDRRPGSIAFSRQHIMIGRLFGGPRFFADNVGEFARFDFAFDEEGLWLLYDGPKPKKAPNCMLVPWRRITLKKDKGHLVFFDIEADDPVEISVGSALGQEIKRRLPALSDQQLA